MTDYGRHLAEVARMAEENRRRQQDIRDNWLYWQQFWAFFDRQRDELIRTQQEAARHAGPSHSDRHADTGGAAHRPETAPWLLPEAVDQARREQADLVRMVGGSLHGTDPSGLSDIAMESGEYSSGHMRREFMAASLDLISAQPGHPLSFLIDPETGHWKSTAKYDDDPSVQAGHLVSRHAMREERFALEDATFNQWSSNRGESQGGIFLKDAVDIGGVPVERRTALEWETAGLLAKGTVAAAEESNGWRLVEERDALPTLASSLREAVADHHARVQRQTEDRELWLWWQRFWGFFDQQRDELQRRQREDAELTVARALIEEAGSGIQLSGHPLHWLLEHPPERRDEKLLERLAHVEEAWGRPVDR